MPTNKNKKGTKRSNFDMLDQQYFDETPRGIKAVNIMESKKEKVKILGFQKYYKKQTDNGKIQFVPRGDKKSKFYVRFDTVSKLIEILINYARKFRWEITGLFKEPDAQKQIVSLQQKIIEMEMHISKIEEEKQNLQKGKLLAEEQIEKLKKDIVKNNLPEFKKDVEEFTNILERCSKGELKEEDLQKFLKERTWLFGVEYRNAKPKKLAGSTSVFDFLLENYAGQGVIVELKLPTEEIFKEKYVLTSKVSDAMGQLIRYIETTLGIAYSSEMSKIEGITEKRPLGYVIIGRTKNDDEREDLKRVNSYYHRIEVLTYDDLLLKAKTTLESFLKET